MARKKKMTRTQADAAVRNGTARRVGSSYVDSSGAAIQIVLSSSASNCDSSGGYSGGSDAGGGGGDCSSF